MRNYFAGANVDEITYQYCKFNANGEIYNLTIDKINQAVYVNGTYNDAFDSVVLLYFGQAPLYTINNNGSRDFSITFEDVMGGNYTVGVMNNHDFNTYIFNVKFEMRVPNFIISEDEVYENLTDAIDAVAENGVIYANVNYYYEDNMEININKSFTLKNFRDDGVIFDGNSTQWFFTIAEGCTVVFDGIYFTDGVVKTHASIENYGTLIIRNCTFESFETSAIIYNSGLLNILNSTFSLNFVNNAVVWNEKDLVIDTVEFSSNIVNISSVVYNNGAAEIISANFTENYNFANGGAIYNAKSLIVNDTVFTENEGIDGGAIYSTGTLTVLNSTFEDNTANGYGGAIYNGNEASIFNSTFTGSSSEFDGGAIYNNNVMIIDNSTFVGNTATGRGGAIYNNKSLELAKSLFGINFAEEYANIYNAGDIQFGENIFDFYDVILVVPDGEYGIPTTITGTLNPEFNMDLQLVLPGFVNKKDALVTISEGVFEYTTDILPKGIYDVVLNEVIYDVYGNIYYGEAITDRLVINKANVYINLTVDDIVLRNTDQATPVLKINASKDGLLTIVFNNKILEVNITGGQATLTLDAVGEGNYTVFAAREGDENHNDAVNTTTFKVTEYEGNFIVNSTGGKYDTLREAIAASSNDDVIYVREGTYSGYDNVGLNIYGKKLSIIALGDVVFQANPYSYFLDVKKSADVTICGVVIVGFNSKNNLMFIYNDGNLTLDGCILTNNTAASRSIIHNFGDLTIVDSEFYDNTFNGSIIFSEPKSNLIVKESTFENNTLLNKDLILIDTANSVKIISSVFAENKILSDECSIICAVNCTDVVISSEFYNNTQSGNVIGAYENTNLYVDNSIFTGNTIDCIIHSGGNTQNTISGCVFTDNAVNNVVLSQDNNLSVLESTFSDNTILGNGALYIASGVNAIVNGSVFANNKGTGYRNIFSDSPVDVSNSVFDALNVDFTVHDIDYGQNETIEGTIDIGTNLIFTVNLDINSNSYSVNVTDNKFTYNAGILNGGDYTVVLNPKDANSNTFVFDKITKVFTVSRIDPGLSVSIDDITQGEKLNVTSTIAKNAKGNVVYELNGNVYSKAQLENLTLNPGNYLVTAVYRGDKNYIPASEMVNVKVNKVAPNITVNDVAVSYGDEIKINVTVDVADYYTVFLDNGYDESVSLYVENSAIFTFNGLDYEPSSYEITVYVFESDNYAEAYAYATLTVNKAVGFFNLSNDLIIEGENATINVSVPINAYGNITYRVYDRNVNLVYNITQSCLEDLIVPNLDGGTYIVTGTFEGDSYYANSSRVNSGSIFVRELVNVNITVSNITYGENATVTVESNVDGDYLVNVGTEPMVINVKNGVGNASVPNLSAGSYAANVTVVDGNYAGFNETVFDVAIKSVSVAVNVEDIVFGENAVVQVNGEIDGEYIVEIYGQNYTVNVVNGKGNTTIDGLAAGNNILVSVTIADGNYSAQNTTTFNIANKYNTTISLDVVTDENNVTMTVTVNDAATGLIKFQVTGPEEYVVYSDIINGVAVLEDVLETGDYTVIATYMGNDRFNTNITYADFTIKGHIKKNTTIDAQAEVNGYRVTLTVNVDENATGFVKLTVGGTVANIEVVDGVATLTTNLLPNSYIIDVTYLGDDDFNMNNTMVTFTVTEISKENTTIDLNVIAGEDTALIEVDLNETATGLVKLYMVSKETGEEYTMYMDVVDGHVETFTNSIEPGNYTIVATYMGDSVFNTNTTSQDVEILGHIMKDTPIDVTVATSANRVTLTVKVNENATGFVRISVGSTVANIELESGEGTLTTVLPYGSYSLDITYLGDENYNENSTKAEFTLVEPEKENSPISLDIITDENYVGMTVTVSDAATGLVKFQVTGEEEYVVYSDVINGKAILEDVLTVGDYSVIATYMGDDRFNTNITYGDFTIKGHIKKNTTINAHADVIGNRVTLTVKVDENATGFVKLSIGSTVTNIEVVDGVATLTTSLVPNSYYVDVTYLGDDDYNMNSTKVTFTITEVSKKNTNIDLDIIAGEDAALIEVDLNKAATGLVKLYMLWKETDEEYTMYMDVIDGHVETYTNSIEPGNYTIVATYMGDSVFNTNTTSQDVEILGHIMKDTPITADVVANGNRVTLTAKVNENATGFVEVKFGENVFNIALKDGIGTLTTSLPYGSYSLDITYLGDENYNMNSTICDFTVVEPAKENTPISLDIVTYENDVLMTVTVDEAATGLVKFQVTGEEEFTLYVDVINGEAVVEEVLLTGDYNVIATYMGDSRFNTNITYDDFTIKGHIKKDTPITAYADVIGNRVTLTVNVDDNATGFVKLAIGSTVTNIEVVNGVAKLTTSLVPNSYYVDVTYLGDNNYNMNKTKVTFTVTEASKKDTPIDLNVTAGEEFILITVDLDKAATGLVKLYMVWKETGENITAYMDVINGHVETLTNSLLPGNYSVVATYMGDSVFNTNTTSQDVEILGHIMKDTPITADVVANGNRVTLTAKVNENATGFVELKFGDNVFNIALKDGVGTLTTSLPYGSYSLDITYLGDENFNKNSTKLEFTLVEPEKENTPISMDIVTYEDEVWMTVTVDDAATGLVKFQVTGSEEFTLYVDVINGKALVDEVLLTGDYNVIATYMGDSRFNTNITYGDFTIKGHIKKNTTINARADVIGNRVTLTVNVDDEATGFVKLSIGSTVTNIEVVDGVATLTTTLAPNSYYVDVTYLGDDDYNMNNTKVTFTITEVSKLNTPIDLNVLVGEDAALIMVDLDEATTGLVKLYMVWEETGEEYTMYMDVVDGHVETYTNNIEPGNYTIVATYMGDSVFNTNTTSQDVEIIGHIMKDTPITADVVANGNRVTLTVKVDENATGFVEVKFSGGVFNIGLENGKGTLTTTLPYGSYSLDITYLGDENYNKNSTKCEFTVVEPEKENTPISLDIVTDENYVGMTITVDETATGLVKFQVTGEEEYVVYSDVINGKAILEDVLVVGDYNVIATYMGDSRFNTNITYGDFTIKGHIKKDTPIIAYADVIGNRVTIIVAVDEEATGFVKLTVGGTVANIEVEDGIATLTTILVPNSYYVDVTYLGDDDFNMNNTAVTFTITEVSKQNTTIDLNVIVDENNAMFDVDLNESATGLVKFYIINKETGEEYTAYMDIEDGYAGMFINDMEPGNYTVSATYMGDSVFNTNITSEDFEIALPEDANITINVNDNIVSVELPEDAEGYVIISVDGKNYYFDADDEIELDISDLAPGNYTVEVLYSGDNKYAPDMANTTVEIPEVIPEDANLTADAKNTTITVTVAENATGNVLVDVNGIVYYADVENGQATVEVIGLDEGTYEAVVTYSGDETYAPANVTVAVTVPPASKNETDVDPKANVTVSEDTVIMELPEDATGYMLVDVDGTGYYVPVENSTTTFKLPQLAPGNHTVRVTYTGDKKYAPANATETIEVPAPEETIISEDLTKVEKAPQRFAATFLDENGNPLANANVTFDVNGVVYTRTTNANGSASIAINLIAGNYTITLTNPATGEVKTNNITVLSRFVEDYDLVKYFRNDTQYVLKVLDDEGNPAKAGEVITYNINGVFYNRTTNATGHVKLNINLDPGKYIITAEYKGCKVAHNVTVIPVLTASDFTKKFGETGAFEAKLVDGQGNPYKEQQIKFNINGVFYNRYTNGDGIAKLNINLLPGEYIITSTYGYAIAANHVTVTA
ncbi:Ig-like domain repeat protein [Methanobrevibacter sp.]|uniref:Ig-like domain repeat protein n=1 Tax=Methanobrevibacter sp. TaxID=66852 RepID=UPI00388FC77D